jgi:hypothetical protein
VRTFAYVAAVVLFVLAAFGAHGAGVGELDLIAAGLVAFVLGHVLPE